MSTNIAHGVVELHGIVRALWTGIIIVNCTELKLHFCHYDCLKGDGNEWICNITENGFFVMSWVMLGCISTWQTYNVARDQFNIMKNLSLGLLSNIIIIIRF